MNSDKELVSQNDLLTIIEDYITRSTGLSLADRFENEFSICQKGDSKKIRVRKTELADVLVRRDGDGREFVQVNLSTGRKILLTDQLIGFKPHPVPELDVSKLPRVVTTLDLMSVFEAIEESSQILQAAENLIDETETLKRVFQAILMGGEDVGFDLSVERSWLKRLPMVTSKTSA